jgi:hypothetical protein
MVMIDEQKIEENYNKFMEYVKADSRADQLVVMYEDYGNELMTAPASGKSHYHNTFPGGYIDHVLRVVEATLQFSSLYKKMGGTINFTKEEAVFSALHHDLGKLGNPGTAPYYLDQDSDWHRKRGELYKHNPNLPYMQVPDRALMTLQRYGIKLTDTEWLSIKLSDGLYDESTKAYLKTFTPYPLENSLPRIIHVADYISSQVENDFTRF